MLKDNHTKEKTPMDWTEAKRALAALAAFAASAAVNLWATVIVATAIVLIWAVAPLLATYLLRDKPRCKLKWGLWVAEWGEQDDTPSTETSSAVVPLASESPPSSGPPSNPESAA